MPGWSRYAFAALVGAGIAAVAVLAAILIMVAA